VEEDYVLVHNLGIDGNTSTDILARFENEIKLRLWPDCKSLIAAARKYTEKILFLGFSPSDESKTTPLLWDANLFYRNDRAKLYNGLIEKITKEEKVFFVNLRDVFEKDTPKYLCFDGLHLNSQGHKKFFELVRDFLKENKIL
jgi:lysophospholipase L1-like esterase